MIRFLAIFIFLSFPAVAFSHPALKGIVLNHEEKPVAGASVYLNNTSYGTITNSDGKFELQLPSGKSMLIVSFIGYETFTLSIDEKTVADLTIHIRPKEKVLDNVVVQPFMKDGWIKWGRFFTDNFLGKSAYGQDSRIVNYKSIRFRDNKGLISASSLEPLIIENSKMGYVLKFDLDEFWYDTKTRYMYFQGYAYFQDMEGSEKKKQKWKKNREEAYLGSLMHFMRAVYRNKIAEEGFDVYPLKKLPNLEKERVREASKKNTMFAIRSDGTRTVTYLNYDSADYYRKIMRQQDFTDIITPHTISGDSIAYMIDSVTAGLEFNDYLLVIYKNGKVPKEYIQQFPDNGRAMSSQITLPNHRPVSIESSGYYYHPSDLLTLGFWSWWDKIGAMLPLNYKPGD